MSQMSTQHKAEENFKMHWDNSIGRRSFLKTGAAMIGGLALAPR